MGDIQIPWPVGPPGRSCSGPGGRWSGRPRRPWCGRGSSGSGGTLRPGLPTQWPAPPTGPDDRGARLRLQDDSRPRGLWEQADLGERGRNQRGGGALPLPRGRLGEAAVAVAAAEPD